jgi:hypothetical protein
VNDQRLGEKRLHEPTCLKERWVVPAT